MIGRLPASLSVGGTEMEIDTDYRTALRIFYAFTDEEADEEEKCCLMIELLYRTPDRITDMDEAVRQAIWYLNCGRELPGEEEQVRMPLYDWKKDEQLIFSAVNKVAGTETRTAAHIHYWTWMGYFNEIDEGLFTNIVAIRDKKNSGKKLEKWEQEFYRKNREIIDLESARKKELKESIYRELEKAGIL